MADTSGRRRDSAPAARIPLVRPEQVRVTVRQLRGWPQSASALFDWLREQITREDLQDIVSMDPFGAPAHLRILVQIWKSGRVPSVLEFDPCEALRLYQGSPRADVRQDLSLAFCRTLLCISPSTYGDDSADYAAPLVESCLAVGGEAPALAEQLLAWLAVSELPDVAELRDDHDCSDPALLLAMALLRIAADPDDALLPDIIRAVTDAVARPDTLPWHLLGRVPDMTNRAHRRVWGGLVMSLLAPRRSASPDVDRLMAALRG